VTSEQTNPSPPPPTDLRQFFGNIDVYLFDQLLKGRVAPGMRILDAGAGDGRNIIYLLRAGYDVFAVDSSEASVQHLRELAAKLAPGLPAENFRRETIDRLSFDDASFDMVISSAVLHFADDDAHFRRMVKEMWRVLATEGMFFCRLASTIGIENEVRHLGGGRYHLPDGTDRFLVDETILRTLTDELNGTPLEPIKTVNVENRRCMTTWCLRKK
jgi:SAM-dependent methyltransferase